ncbi:MAG: endonuclease/exonuclease/phosphatase family protein [Bacillota bacterium]
MVPRPTWLCRPGPGSSVGRQMRRQYVILLAVIALTMFVLQAVQPSARTTLTGAVPGEQLVFLSYNIRHGRGLDRRVSLDRIATVLADSGADIIGLNEVDRRVPRSRWQDQARFLGQQLGFNHVFGTNVRWALLGEYGNALLSRFPITEYRNYRLPGPDGRSEPRGLLVAKIRVGQVELNVGVTHLGVTAAERRGQLAEVARIMAELNGPVILLGDFNLSASAPEMEILTQTLSRAGGGEPLLTYPANRPVADIDHLFYRGLYPIRAEVLESEASDHRPVRVIFPWPDPGE